MAEHSTASSALKLPRTVFHGTNYASWHKSLMNEAGGHGLAGWLPNSKELLLSKITGKIKNPKERRNQLETALKNE